MRRIAVFVGPLSLLLLTTTVAVSSAQTGSSPQGAKNQADEAFDYRIGSEDTIEISVWKNDALSRRLPVRPDGKITLPLLNDVQASGLTPMELREVLIGKLKDVMTTPEVSVIVVEPRSYKISIIGEVARPGVVVLRSRTTMLELLAMVGGVTQFAGRSRIFVIRRDGATQKKIPFNYNRALSADPEQENFYLQPNDLVVIP